MNELSLENSHTASDRCSKFFCKKMIEVFVSEKHYLHSGSFKEQEDETMFDHLPFHDHSTFCHQQGN
jgi:hypothetical protein